MKFGLALNSTPPVWMNDALFMVFSLVAGRGSETAQLSAGGRDSAGKQGTWLARSLRRGDRVSFVVQDQQPFSERGSAETSQIVMENPENDISGFVTHAPGKEPTVVNLGEHETLQAVGTYDVVSGYFRLEVTAVTSNSSGYTVNGDSFTHEQTLNGDFPLVIAII